MALSAEEIAKYAYAAGFRGEALVLAVAIAFPESGGNPHAHNPNAGTGDNSYGLWQINMLGGMGPARRQQFGLSSNDELFDPLTNAKAAFAISGGGKNFGPWTTYKKGMHQAHLNKAAAAVRALGEDVGQLPTGYTPGSGGGGVGGVAPPPGPALPSEEEVRAMFRDLLGRDPDDDELGRFMGQTSRQAKELMLSTEEGLEMSLLRGVELLRADIG